MKKKIVVFILALIANFPLFSMESVFKRKLAAWTKFLSFRDKTKDTARAHQEEGLLPPNWIQNFNKHSKIILTKLKFGESFDPHKQDIKLFIKENGKLREYAFKDGAQYAETLKALGGTPLVKTSSYFNPENIRIYPYDQLFMQEIRTTIQKIKSEIARKKSSSIKIVLNIPKQGTPTITFDSEHPRPIADKNRLEALNDILNYYKKDRALANNIIVQSVTK